MLSGQQALSSLSDNGLCAIYLLLIFSVATLVVSLPRTLSRLGWLGLISVILIGICGLIAMIGAGVNPTPGRLVQGTLSTSFYEAFLAVTGPVSTSSSVHHGDAHHFPGLLIRGPLHVRRLNVDMLYTKFTRILGFSF